MRIKQNGPGAAADPAQQIAHRIDFDFVKPQRDHSLLEEPDDQLFLPGIAFYPDQVLREFEKFLALFRCQ